MIISGAGGGFDVFAGLPLYFALRAAGKEVFLANLSFTYLGATDGERLTPVLVAVRPETTGPTGYFPELHLASFLATTEKEPVVYAFEKVGVVPLRHAWSTLVERLGADAIVLVDGGTDILMRGDEAGLGTPSEDMVSLAAVAPLPVPVKLVCCVGFGIDTFHGVCHAHFLENVAALSREGGYLGAQALLPSMPEARRYLEAVEHSSRLTPRRPSIVNTSIASAIEGQFGDHHRTERTRDSTLFINPLMSILWTFDLEAVARRSLYLKDLEGTVAISEVVLMIEAFRDSITPRKWAAIPH